MVGVVVASLLLAGCNKSAEVGSVGPKSQGRFAGIGVFDAGRLWSDMTVAHSSTDAATAKIADDEHIIIVLDSHTGEVRQCGDHRGYCVAMDPWAAGQGALPTKLKKARSQLPKFGATVVRCQSCDDTCPTKCPIENRVMAFKQLSRLSN